MMDDTIKTILIDDSAIASQIVSTVCQKIGIANPDEYSLLLENDSSKKGGDDGNYCIISTYILFIFHVIFNIMIPIDFKLGRWVNPEKTFAEQGIVETDVLLLKKKFFFSDQNVDRNDPIQLNLIYVQSRDAIITGKHPCTFEEATQLAALQLQVQHGNHEPDKHKPGFLK